MIASRRRGCKEPSSGHLKLFHVEQLAADESASESAQVRAEGRAGGAAEYPVLLRREVLLGENGEASLQLQFSARVSSRTGLTIGEDTVRVCKLFHVEQFAGLFCIAQTTVTLQR